MLAEDSPVSISHGRLIPTIQLIYRLQPASAAFAARGPRSIVEAVLERQPSPDSDGVPRQLLTYLPRYIIYPPDDVACSPIPFSPLVSHKPRPTDGLQSDPHEARIRRIRLTGPPSSGPAVRCSRPGGSRALLPSSKDIKCVLAVREIGPYMVTALMMVSVLWDRVTEKLMAANNTPRRKLSGISYDVYKVERSRL